MNKTAKKISLILAVMLMVAMLMTTAMAADTLQVKYSLWTIPGESERSGTKTWKATKSATSTKANQNIYVKAGARLQNTGAETTYFVAIPSASSPTTNRIQANGQYGYIRGVDWSCTQGNSYGLWHQRYDQTLNTEIVDGITSLYIK